MSKVNQKLEADFSNFLKTWEEIESKYIEDFITKTCVLCDEKFTPHSEVELICPDCKATWKQLKLNKK